MKKITFFMALLVSCSWLAKPCLAQTLEERIQNTCAPLDKREIQSGILMQQTPIFLRPGKYDGENVADARPLSLDHFGILYGQFRGAAIGKSVLPDPSVYLSKIPKAHQRSNVVPLTCMAVVYDYIRAGYKMFLKLKIH